MAQPHPRSTDDVIAAKHALIHRGLLAGLDQRDTGIVRPAIERSWRRSVSLGVPPESMTHREIGDVDPDSRLQRACRPVADRLMDQLSDLDVAIVVCDRQGQIVLRAAASHHLRRLDDIGAMVGFDFSEPTVGTNGLGTAIEESAPVVVHGAEHFNAFLEGETCAGAPIKDPSTGRTVGTLSLTSPEQAASPLLASLTVSAAAQIEHQLAAMGTHRRQAIMRAFDRASARTRDPLAVVSAEEVFANTSGLTFLGPEAHGIIWEHLSCRNPSYWPHRISLDLPVGRSSLSVEPLGDVVDERAFLIRFEVAGPADHEHQDAGTASNVATPALHPDPAVARALTGAWSDGGPVVIAGPAGSGKRFVSERLAHRPVTVIDATDLPPRWSAAAADRLRAGEVVLLRHLEDLPTGALNRLVRVAADSEAGPGRLVLNLNPSLASPAVSAAVATVCHPVELPPLSGHGDWVRSYARSILARSGRTPPVLSAPAVRVLERWTWPGNVAELRRVLREAAGDGSRGVIEETALPAAMVQHAATGRLRGLARSEREAIIGALREAAGNRSAAAEALGIGRTTLYRKMRTLRIDETDYQAAAGPGQRQP